MFKNFSLSILSCIISIQTHLLQIWICKIWKDGVLMLLDYMLLGKVFSLKEDNITILTLRKLNKWYRNVINMGYMCYLMHIRICTIESFVGRDFLIGLLKGIIFLFLFLWILIMISRECQIELNVLVFNLRPFIYHRIWWDSNRIFSPTREVFLIVLHRCGKELRHMLGNSQICLVMRLWMNLLEPIFIRIQLILHYQDRATTNIFYQHTKKYTKLYENMTQ